MDEIQKGAHGSLVEGERSHDLLVRLEIKIS
jgi:hypothetical protein